MAKKRKTSENNRKFKGVWIPAEYWLDENLTIMEVVLITEIDSLDGENGCFASNKHFADFLGVTAGRASQLIKNLSEKGYISVSYNTQNNVTQRVIRVFRKLNTPVKKLNRGIKNTKGVFRKCVTSNTSSNTSISNTVSLSSEDTTDDIKDPFDDISDKDRQTFINKLINSVTDDCGIPISDNQRQQIAKMLLGLTTDDAETVMTKVKQFVQQADNPVGYIIQSIKNRESEI
ncbi:helix-turn-helix domain-containing protein [Lactobacillus gallinarum]|uniref:helix-turn-helix domain-containing protein n=1 Tax=Lactobacillus gallinarum TaxID=52242 RepID=UPI0024B08AE2|nr:helix-turn-helix domain-containing protein [Lactobacillus gallinarum]